MSTAESLPRTILYGNDTGSAAIWPPPAIRGGWCRGLLELPHSHGILRTIASRKPSRGDADGRLRQPGFNSRFHRFNSRLGQHEFPVIRRRELGHKPLIPRSTFSKNRG